MAVVARDPSSNSGKDKQRKPRTISAGGCCLVILAVLLLPTSIVRGGGGRGRGVAIIAAARGRGRVAAGSRGRGVDIIAGAIGGAGASRRPNAGRARSYPSSFASAAPTTTSSLPRQRSSSAVRDAPSEAMSSCGEDDGEGDEFSSSSTPSWSSHPDDPGLWLYHVETTTSTMDEARRIVEGKFALDRDEVGDDDDDTGAPAAFLVSATSQSNGRGTTNRNWEGSRGGNALFTIGVPQSSWTDGLRSRNDGTAVPLTLLPLKIGSLVAFHTRRALRECVPKFDRDDDGAAAMPAVTVKWPNDVLLRTSPLRVVGDDDGGGDGGGDPGPSHEKIAGVLVETSRDWFLVGIGINVGYAPQVPSEGADRGRKATCLARYCHPDDDETTAVVIVGEEEGEDGAGDDVTRWIEASRKLATDVAYDLHSWLHSSPGARRQHSGESILEDWKSYVDWDMELTLRDTPNRERVTLEGVLEDGRAVVREVETGRTRTLVSDYFL